MFLRLSLRSPASRVQTARAVRARSPQLRITRLAADQIYEWWKAGGDVRFAHAGWSEASGSSGAWHWSQGACVFLENDSCRPRWHCRCLHIQTHNYRLTFKFSWIVSSISGSISTQFWIYMKPGLGQQRPGFGDPWLGRASPDTLPSCAGVSTIIPQWNWLRIE